ncbi:probable cationic amino acid transporter [Phycodurus eques]|uniref:probable cationic amino acid transporter n=1 Tax=Phycodurus eques TaxID=693459 RepID=UPI002ACD89BE|nr:probable cationic amino acid transporter [Phycodurus eques]
MPAVGLAPLPLVAPRGTAAGCPPRFVGALFNWLVAFISTMLIGQSPAYDGVVEEVSPLAPPCPYLPPLAPRAQLAMSSWADAWRRTRWRLLRTKPVGAMAHGGGDPSELAKVLTAPDLVSLGVGSCAGTGMYVVAGLVAKSAAGPGVVLSFVVAAAASVLSGVCYAELGVRVPRTTGSAYTYSYVTVGESVAFLIGWNLILEYLIGTAAGASALGAAFDSLADRGVSRYATAHLPALRGFGKGEDTFPDPLAMFIALLVTLIVTLGARNSVALNNVLNGINALVWVFVVTAGLFFLSAENWEGGEFLPYGWSGVMRGAATCFYAFIGFDIIATAGEEARDANGASAIPRAITASLLTCLCAYVSVSVILTLTVPYDRIDGSAPLVEMFAARGFLWGKYVAAAGSVAGLGASLLGSLFPMPRIIYAMAADGLLFRSLSHVSPRTRTPAAACVLSGTLASLVALLVSLRDLIEMMSIGTLLAYTLVSVCVLLLRYQPDGEPEDGPELDGTFSRRDTLAWLHVLLLFFHSSDSHCVYMPQGGAKALETERLGERQGHASSMYAVVKPRLPDVPAAARPTASSGRTVTRCTLAFFALSFLLWTAVIFGAERGSGTGAAAVWGLTAALTAAAMAALLLAVARQPQSGRRLDYAAPCVPFVPAAAILVNSYLMLKLSALTWARFSVWCAVGLLIYVFYGVWHSSLEVNARQEEAHASSYRRFDDPYDDPRERDDRLDRPPAPPESDFRYQNDAYDAGPSEDDGGRFGYQSGGGGGGG